LILKAPPYDPPSPENSAPEHGANELPAPAHRYLLAATALLSALIGVLACICVYDYLTEPLTNSVRYQLMVLPILCATVSFPLSLVGVFCWWRCKNSLSLPIHGFLAVLYALPIGSFAAMLALDS
jgi:hypothetical protein